MSDTMYAFNWAPERYDTLRRWVHDEAGDVRVVRPVVPLFGDEGSYIHSIPDNKVVVGRPGSGEPLSIKPGKTLAPVELAVAFRLEHEQREDELAIHTLACRAAYLTGLAEDAVCLGGRLATAFLEAHNVENRGVEDLADQDALFKEEPPEVEQDVLSSFLEALQKLRDNNHHGPFAAIVTPALWVEAFTPRKNTVDAPIYEICPHLREGCPHARQGGFVYNPAILELRAPPDSRETGKTAKAAATAPEEAAESRPGDGKRSGSARAGGDAAGKRAGVVISTGGASMGLTIPVDIHVELGDQVGGQIIMRVVEQFRLRLSDPTAAVEMR